ncbi:hypothetical protein IDJ75_11520 [Mucilaginibacter rigui]|uniref:Uncharacterized protein n=1 Tax=Mucilaginibacter rigui TaxID=534635 RepID=A0ABR7X5Q5_9SPHI|nr:hypothetical protein [Mucilaginibacter rigui]MBD1385911.1 hypothetical protein [Mucilaginibacter rigui]
MNDLLELAIEAHGGMDRWNKIKSINAELSIGGAIWYVKGNPDVLQEITISADTRQEKVVMKFPRQDKLTVFQPGLIAVKENGAKDFQYFSDPKSIFAGHKLDTPWKNEHIAYFSGEALWTYLTIPFLYTEPGFQTEEIEPWEENGEIWRRLKVIFPENVVSHCREQLSYFGSDGLLRRHDYTVDILGGATGANYAYDYRQTCGLMIPRLRKVYAFEGEAMERKTITDPLLVSITFHSINCEE